MNTPTYTELLLPLPDNAEAAGWQVDPALLSFSEYRDRCLWGPPDSLGWRHCLNLRHACDAFHYSVCQKENAYANGEDPHYGSWTKALECGRSYLVGEAVPLAAFVRKHTSSLTDWQRLAYRWCLANPSQCLILSSQKLGRIYKIMKRGEYIEIGLPHQDFGGEKQWVSRDGKTKVLVNVD